MADTDDAFDIVVVGAGNAGIPAAVEAGAAGARVLLVEKDVRIGGTLHSTGGHLSAAGTQVQARHGIEDSVEAHLADIRRITGGTHREDLVELAVTHAADTVDWLDEHGFRFDPATPRIVHGHEDIRRAVVSADPTAVSRSSRRCARCSTSRSRRATSRCGRTRPWSGC